jgi:N utilization substance protein A
VLPPSEQVRIEHYRPGQRLKVYLLEVHKASRGPQVTVSRTHKNLLRRLFELEVPEIFRGSVEIKAIAREPGFRSKVAVWSRQEGIDPVGACVGLRGIRIQNIVNELGGERIDVVQWDPDPAQFVANALSPAQVLAVRILPDGTTGEAVVGDRQLSLAIGKEGQNARLAAKLTGLRIDIKSQSAAAEDTGEGEEPKLEMSAEPDVKRETPIWEELAAAEEAERQREQERREMAPAIAAELQQPGAPMDEPAVLRPAATVSERPGAVRFASDVLPGTRPEDLTRNITGGGRRRGGGGPRGGQRETEEQARARRAAASRRGGSRRAMEEEIEEEMEAMVDDDDDYGFLT